MQPTLRQASNLTRREFVRLLSLAGAGLLAGCAANPVTGRSQLMLVSEEQEIQMDQQNSPYQFSADYGSLQDKALNDYIARTGNTMAARTHRPHMPYSFRGVNATYVNAYAFPGGSIAATRGILLSLENEAELAALLGHELGHVNARHTAEIMSKKILASTVIGGVAVYAGTKNAAYGGLAASLGMLGSGVLLASYSRENERQADALGMEYTVKSDYGPDGMVGLMEMLSNLSKHKASTTELLFATHPMSDERLQTAVASARSDYATAKNQPLHRERYMDHTAGLRKIKGAIEELQKGETLMAQEQFAEAQAHLQSALKQAPDDYAGLVMMAKCQLVLKKNDEAQRYTEKAKQVFPEEAQAYNLDGYVKIQKKQYEAALEDFNAYEKRLPGNPTTTFFMGFSYEGLEKRKEAAEHYYRFLKVVNEGKQAQYAYRRLVEWGYVK
jgi:beta-barrel assembly-enhancing protease